MRTIYVYENWLSECPSLIGKLFIDTIKGDEIYSFEYSDDWLKNSASFILDPDLSFYRGRQYSIKKQNFGLFQDSSPDRWGQLLMRRREANDAVKENRKPRALRQSDFLLGVYDETRMGALRFSLEEGGPFLSNDNNNPTPPWASLRSLEEASREFEKGEIDKIDNCLKQLLKPGSSLGGARPKANVLDPNGDLWIAKFPSKNDFSNVGAWEKVVHDLAKLCNLNVPQSRLEVFSDNGSTFLVKRFDRIGKNRIHFASAMTMLGLNDGTNSKDGVGFLDIALFIKSNGSSPKEDLIELWKRVVFNIAVSNTDCHLRNHGFILTKSGWRLSPLFDVNPSPEGDELALNISESSNKISIDLAIETAHYYGIKKDDAYNISAEILSIIKDNWENLAKKYNLKRNDIEYMRPAFSACYQ